VRLGKPCLAKNAGFRYDEHRSRSVYRGMLKTWMLWADALLGGAILQTYPWVK
jgi:hypothetical protein